MAKELIIAGEKFSDVKDSIHYRVLYGGLAILGILKEISKENDRFGDDGLPCVVCAVERLF